MTLVMALFQKQVNCPSDKAITMCGTTNRTMRLMPVRHNRIGTFAENKLRLVPTTMCRLTSYVYSQNFPNIIISFNYILAHSDLSNYLSIKISVPLSLTIRLLNINNLIFKTKYYSVVIFSQAAHNSRNARSPGTCLRGWRGGLCSRVW